MKLVKIVGDIMKYVYKILLSTFIFVFFSVISIDNLSAHPGRTDENGCHTCWTNCDKWGLDYGEYHCHNPKNNYVAPQSTPKPTTNYSYSTSNYLVSSNSSSSNNVSNNQQNVSSGEENYGDFLLVGGFVIFLFVLYRSISKKRKALKYSGNTSHCPYCGNHVQPEDLYCSKCGRKLK